MKTPTIRITFIFYFIILTMFAQPPTEGGTEFSIGDLISVPSSTNINLMIVDTRTIETYFKVDNSNDRQIIYEEGGAVAAFSVFVESGYINVGTHTGSGSNSIYYRKAILNDTWYHIALVLDHSAPALEFYFNGVIQDSTEDAFSIPSHSGGIGLGYNTGSLRYPDCATWTNSGSSQICINDTTSSESNSYFFSGHLWGFRVWDTARTAVEIDTNKDILITDTSTSPGNDLLLFLDDDFNSVTYLDSNDIYQSTDFVLEVNKPEVLEATTRVYLNNHLLQIETLNTNIVNSVKIYSINGKLIVDKQYNEEINLSSLSKGVYIVKLNFENQNTTVQRKILIY